MSKAIKLSRTDLVKVIDEAKGSIQTIGFIKKDKTERFITGNRNKGKTSKLGYLYFNDFQAKKDKIKCIDPRTIFSVKSGKKEYVVK